MSASIRSIALVGSRVLAPALALALVLALATTDEAHADDGQRERERVARALDELDAHDVVWDSPGLNASGSMPIGNGQLGANAWIDERGDVLLLLSHTDAFSECERLLKLGRVRIACDPPLDLARFQQRLSWRRGAIEISTGAGDTAAEVRIVVDTGAPAIHVAIEGRVPRTIRATLETWRTAKRRIEGPELVSSWMMRDAPADVVVEESADVIVPRAEEPDAVVWFHRNEWSVVPLTLRHQGLSAIASSFEDPLIHRTFGARLAGIGFARVDATTIATTAPVASAKVAITAACEQAEDLRGWLARLRAGAQAAPPFEVARERTARWWTERFSRSWVFVDVAADSAAPAAPRRTTLSQAYAAQRFATLAATRGAFPVKFNGSIFTVEPRWVNGAPFDPDFRNWGGDYWWQNTRLPYHGMLARGDGDHLASLFGFYARSLPGCAARARLYHGVEGAYFPETMTTFATYGNGDYGWDRDGAPPNEVHCPYWQWAWNQGLELVALMLDHHDHTGDDDTLRSQTLPMAHAVLAYFDSRFARDEHGALVISPTQAIETYWSNVTNDAPTVAGLREVVARLCALPPTLGGAEERALWERLRAACPPLPLEQDASGAMKLAPAAAYAPNRSNCESPELYGVWPFQLAGVERGLLDEARLAYATRRDRFTNGWPQDGMDAARLGLATDAAANVLAKIRNTHPNFRFPTFWGPNFDWVPDQCHGGNLLTTVQEMLVQSVGSKLIVLPAWPRDWNARFRLHAPRQTTITGEVKDGELVSLEIDPPRRAADVVVGDGWSLPRRGD